MWDKSFGDEIGVNIHKLYRFSIFLLFIFPFFNIIFQKPKEIEYICKKICK